MNKSEDDKTDPFISIPNELQKHVAKNPGKDLHSLGIIGPLMKDPAITEVMINDFKNIFVEREGKLGNAGVAFASKEDLQTTVLHLIELAGKTLHSDTPYLDASLPDGSRLNVVFPPAALHGPSVTLRKFPSQRYSATDLVTLETLDQKMAYFLNLCVLARINILICGGTGSGKSTLLNALTAFVPKSERIVLIEDTPELILNHANSVRLQTIPPTPGSPAVSIRDLVVNSLRMRPDRIIVGECRKTEAFDILQAMNTGHSGSMTTIHANSPRDGLSRLETLCLLAGSDLPILAVRKQMANALDLIVQTKRFRDGKRRVTAVVEVTGCEGDVITLQDIFVFDQDNQHFRATGLVPTFVDNLKDLGFDLPPRIFA